MERTTDCVSIRVRHCSTSCVRNSTSPALRRAAITGSAAPAPSSSMADVINSCLALAVIYDGSEITTVEGLAKGDELHPLQTAFVRHEGFQCGYCTSGQLCSAVAMLSEVDQGSASHVTADVRKEGNVVLTDDEIRERMSGNICRCGAYPGIIAAIREVIQPTPQRGV